MSGGLEVLGAQSSWQHWKEEVGFGEFSLA